MDSEAGHALGRAALCQAPAISLRAEHQRDGVQAAQRSPWLRAELPLGHVVRAAGK